jgi:hypothetical protein
MKIIPPIVEIIMAFQLNKLFQKGADVLKTFLLYILLKKAFYEII